MKNLFILTTLLFTLVSCHTNNESNKIENSVIPEEEVSVQSVSEEEPVMEEEKSLSCSGTVQVQPKYNVAVFTKINGLVNTIYVLEGERVKKGQVLAKIEHNDIIKLQENYLKSKAQIEFLEKDYNRKKQLFAEKAISEKEYQLAKSNYLTENAAFESLKNQIDFVGISKKMLDNGEITKSLNIVSPIDGNVTLVNVKTGEYISQDRKSFEIIDDSHKYIQLSVFPSDVAKIHEGQEVIFKVPGNEKEYSAKVLLAGKSIDDVTKSVLVRADLEEYYQGVVVGSQVMAKILLE